MKAGTGAATILADRRRKGGEVTCLGRREHLVDSETQHLLGMMLRDGGELFQHTLFLRATQPGRSVRTENNNPPCGGRDDAPFQGGYRLSGTAAEFQQEPPVRKSEGANGRTPHPSDRQGQFLHRATRITEEFVEPRGDRQGKLGPDPQSMMRWGGRHHVEVATRGPSTIRSPPPHRCELMHTIGVGSSTDQRFSRIHLHDEPRPIRHEPHTTIAPRAVPQVEQSQMES